MNVIKSLAWDEKMIWKHSEPRSETWTIVTLEHKSSLKSLGYICSNSQQYIIWVKKKKRVRTGREKMRPPPLSAKEKTQKRHVLNCFTLEVCAMCCYRGTAENRERAVQGRGFLPLVFIYFECQKNTLSEYIVCQAMLFFIYFRK